MLKKAIKNDKNAGHYEDLPYESKIQWTKKKI